MTWHTFLLTAWSWGWVLAAFLTVVHRQQLREERAREERRLLGNPVLIVEEEPRVVHVGDVPIVPGPPPVLQPIVIGSLTFPRRPAPLHRYVGRNAARPQRIGDRRPLHPQPLMRNPSACLFRPPVGWPHRTRVQWVDVPLFEVAA